MRQLPPVLWTKGVLLSPQHLQAQDRHHEESLAFSLNALSFCPWGISSLDLDQEALSGGTLILNSIAGRFPDGLLFEAPLAGATPPPREVASAFRADQRTLTVYLAAPEYRPGARNVARVGDAVLTRWQADEQLARDETTGSTERPIQVAQPTLRLLLEGESLEGYAVLPVARLLKGSAGEITRDHSFVPPLLDLSASDAMVGLMRRVVERLAARSSALSGSRRQRNTDLADFTVADVGSFWLLYTINTHLPALRHIHEVRRGHPTALWEAMLALAGALSSFAHDADVRTLPTYDHTNPGPCFSELEKRIFRFLDGAVVDQAISLPFKAVRPTLQAVSIDKAEWLDAPQWFLAVSAAMRQQDLITKVTQGCKAGSVDVVDTLIRQALPGIELVHISAPPPAVPVKLDFQYFAIRKSGAAWDAIARSRNMAVYVPAELAAARLELIMVLR